MGATMKDVARHAGVSVATVSHVINETRFVKEETRQKVQDSIRELGYQPNVLARGFKTGRKNLIAFIVPDIASPFFSALIESIESVLTPHGLSLLIVNTKESRKRETDALHLMANGMVDGFIIASSFSDYDSIGSLLSDEMPVIFVDRHLENCPRDMFLIDNYQAVYQSVMHMARKGHRRISTVMGSINTLSTTTERFSAYSDAMQACDLPMDGLIFSANPLSGFYSEHLDAVLDNQATALITPNSAITTEVLSLIDQHHLKLGEDMELIGYKESNQPQFLPRQMNLIVQPTEELGQAAARRMLSLLEDPTLPMKSNILTAVFVPSEERYREEV